MKRLLLLVACLFATSIVFGTAVVEETSSPSEVSITDSADRVLTFDAPPTRVISAAPNITETIFAIGRGDVLVGRTDFCDYPSQVSEVPSIGNLMDPNVETIVSLEPDVVIASSHFQREVADTLASVDIPVVYLFDPGSFEGVYAIIETVGQLLDAEEAAAEVVAGMRADVAEVKATVADVTEKPSVYYVVGFGQWGDFTAGGDTFIGQMLEMVKADNIAKDVEGWAYSFEKIVEADPDMVICSQYWGAKEGLETSDGYKDLPAIADGRLYEFDNNAVDRQGPRLAEGLRALASIVHPGLF